MKAMIFAAGFGTRLRPLTLDVPKAMIEVKQKPMLAWTLEYLGSFGIEEFWINLHYLPQKIEAFITQMDSGCPIRLSFEEEILGTGGGLYNLKDYWDQEVLVMNSDILCDADLTGMIEFHEKHALDVTLAVNQAQSPSMLLMDSKKNLKGVSPLEKPTPNGLYQRNFCGIHLVSPRLFKMEQGKPEFSIIDQYLKLQKKGLNIGLWDMGDAYWIDIGTLTQLQKAEKEFKGLKPHHR